MSFLTAIPEFLQSAAADVADLGSALNVAKSAAAAPTIGIATAAADEVSAAIASVFSAHGEAYQALIGQAAVFHEQFAHALTAAGSAYANTEAAGVSALQTAQQDMLDVISAPAQAVLGHPVARSGAEATNPVGADASSSGKPSGNPGAGNQSTGQVSTATNTASPLAASAPTTAGSAPSTNASSSNAQSPVIATIPASVGSAALSGHYLYVGGANDDTISVIDTSTHTTIGVPIHVGVRPLEILPAPDGGHLYISGTADQGGSAIVVFNTATNTAGAPISFNGSISTMAITPDGTHIYVGNVPGNAVSVFDTASNTIVGNPIPVNDPSWLAITPNGTSVYADDVSHATISVISTTTNTVSATIPITAAGSTPTQAPPLMLISPDGSRVYVDNQYAITTIDTGTNTIVGNPISTPNDTFFMISPDGRYLYVPDPTADTLSVVSTATKSVVGSPIQLANSPGLVSVSPNGQSVYVSGAPNTVTVIDTANNTISDPILVGTNPFPIAAPNGLVYVLNTGSASVSVIDPSLVSFHTLGGAGSTGGGGAGGGMSDPLALWANSVAGDVGRINSSFVNGVNKVVQDVGTTPSQILQAGNDISDMFMNPNYGIFPQTGEFAYDALSVAQPAVGDFLGHLDPVVNGALGLKDAFNAYSDFSSGHWQSGILDTAGVVGSAMSFVPGLDLAGAGISTAADVVGDVGKAFHWF